MRGLPVIDAMAQTPVRSLEHKRPVDADIEVVIESLRRLEHGYGA